MADRIPDPDVYYPLYIKPEAQHAAYKAGLQTHKKISEMNRHERRKFDAELKHGERNV